MSAVDRITARTSSRVIIKVDRVRERGRRATEEALVQAREGGTRAELVTVKAVEDVAAALVDVGGVGVTNAVREVVVEVAEEATTIRPTLAGRKDRQVDRAPRHQRKRHRHPWQTLTVWCGRSSSSAGNLLEHPTRHERAPSVVWVLRRTLLFLFMVRARGGFGSLIEAGDMDSDGDLA